MPLVLDVSSLANTRQTQINVQNGNRSGCHAGDSGGLAQRSGLNALQLFTDLPRKAGNVPERKFAGNLTELGFPETVDLALLLGDIACVFGFGFDSCQQTADWFVT